MASRDSRALLDPRVEALDPALDRRGVGVDLHGRARGAGERLERLRLSSSFSRETAWISPMDEESESRKALRSFAEEAELVLGGDRRPLPEVARGRAIGLCARSRRWASRGSGSPGKR